VAYRAEIEIGVKGARKLQELTSQIKLSSKAASSLAESLGQRGIVSQSLDNYKKALSTTAETLKKVIAGTEGETKAVKEYATALLDAEGAQSRQNRLIDEEITRRKGATQALKAYNAALAAPTKRGAATTMAGSYLRGSFKGGSQFAGPIGPGEASSAFRGQSSPVDQRIARSLALDKERLNVKQGIGKVQESLARLDADSIKQHNARLDLQSNYLTVLRNTTNEIKRASIFEKARLIALRGTSGGQQQGPLAAAGAMGFNVALPMNKAEQKGIDLAQKKLEIIKRTIRSREQLVGLAGSLQKLDIEAKVAIANTNREQVRTNQLKQKELQLEQEINEKRSARRRRLKDAASSGLIGGAFPLLFGQGPGAAIGGGIGGFGGGLAGGQLGFGLSLVGTQLGAAVDQTITSITSLSSSLREPTAALAALKEAGIEVNSSVALQVQQLESAGRAYEAQALLLHTLAQTLGVDAVAELQALDDAQEETQQHISNLKSALIVSLLPALTAAAQGVNIFAGVIAKLGNIKIPGPGGEQQTLDIPTTISQTILSAMVPGGPAFTQLANKALSLKPKPELQASELTPTQQLAQQTKQLKATTDVGSLTLENEITELIGENLRRNNDLLDATVVANKRLIISKTRQLADSKLDASVEEKRLANAVDSNVLKLEGLQRDKNRNEETNKNLELTNSVATAQEANNKKLESASNRLSKQNGQLARQAQQAQALTANLERQLAQGKVAGTEQAKKLAIEQKYEQTLERIAKLKDQSEAPEQRRLAAQIKTNAEARLAFEQEQKRAKALRDAVAPLKQIRDSQEANLTASREYNRLVMEGMLPAEAKRITEFNKQVGLLLKQKTEAIQLVEADILRAKANGANTTALEEQLDILKKQQAVIKGEAGKGPGEGKTPEERIRDQIAVIQGGLNDLLDPTNRIIELSTTIGDAFSESFKGIIDGSMSAREALANLFQRTADHFLDMAVEIIAAQVKMQALKIGLNFFGGGIPGLAKGGPVENGSPYIVGEKGPELFVPNASGTIIPNNKLGSSSGGSGVSSTNVVVNVDAKGSSASGDSGAGKQLGGLIGAAVQSELIKQQRPGGLLSR